MAESIDKPNLIVPLAASYNERGTAGYTQTITNAFDQRKINSIYGPVVNSMTGKHTLYLEKRPGFVDQARTIGVSSDIPYLAIPTGGATPASSTWIFGERSNSTYAGNTVSSYFVDTSNVYYPAYVDRTLISGDETIVLQLTDTLGSGVTSQRAYFATNISSWTKITDSNFAGLFHVGKMEHLDGYAFQMTASSRIFNSNLNTVSTWGASAFLTKAAKQDIAAGLAKLGGLILAFGGSTVEVFHNAGYATGSPLERIPQLSANIGMGKTAGFTLGGGVGLRHYYTVLGNTMYFIGSQENSRGTSHSVYTFNGSRFEKVSNPFIDKIITQSNVTHICPMSFSGKQAVAFILSTPTDSPQIWLMFFPAWNEWFEWNSTYSQAVNTGQFFIGIGQSISGATLSAFATAAETYQDGGVGVSTINYQFLHQFKLPTDGNERKTMPMCAVVGDTVSTALNLGIEFSDDDYQTWTSTQTLDLTSDKKALYRQGAFRSRAVRLSYTGSLGVRLEKFVAQIKR